jgi:NAD(P)-dependent dehydrogenase (short-subunit alcohol dehydrogenase family)
MTSRTTALIVGASRAIGLALAAAYADRGWDVIGTVRGTGRTGLHDLADRSGGRVAVERLEMTDPDQIAALRSRLDGRVLDLLLVNAGIARANAPLPEVPVAEFTEVMVTNALSPVRVVDALRDLVPETGTIAVMSSRQGSLSLNTNGGNEVYRASKSALNQLVRSHVARHPDDPRTTLLLNPGHVRTALGGPTAPLAIEDSVPGLVSAIDAHRGRGGLHFIDYQNNTVPW